MLALDSGLRTKRSRAVPDRSDERARQHDSSGAGAREQRQACPDRLCPMDPEVL